MQQLKTWYAGLEENEQKMVVVAAVVMALLILVFAVIKPLNNSVSTYQQKVKGRQSSVNNWKAALPVIIANRGQTSNASNNRGLSYVITSTTRAFNLRVSRVQEKGADEIQVWFDNVAFNDFIGWVADIQNRYQVKIASVNVRSKDRDGLSSIDIKVQR